MRTVVALMIASCRLAADDWTFVSSPNFELFTTAGAGEARRTVEYFEQVRDFFSRTRSLGPDSKLPVTIVLFRSMKEFRPYSPNEGAAAFYTSDNSRDYIVMSGAGDDDRPVAVHEFMHLLVGRGNLKLPVWLNEGIAELYSTVTPYANRVAIGAVPKGRAISLGMDKWIPLHRLLTVEQNSPEYSSKKHAGAFYAQSWLLTHMLALGDAYRPEFAKFIAALQDGAASDEALAKVYGKTVAAVEKDLQSYYRSNSLKVALFDLQLRKVEAGQPARADAMLVDLNLARILANLGRTEESASQLSRLALQHPDRWQVHDAMGQVAWRRGKREEARDALRKAVQLKPTAWNVYFDYARLAAPDEREGDAVLTALREVVRLNPTHLEARLELGEQMYRMKQYGEAVAHYMTIKSVTPELAARRFLGQAWANLGAEQFDDARMAALSALKYARQDRDKLNADRILEYLNRRRVAEQAANGAAAVPVPAVAATHTDEREGGPQIGRSTPGNGTAATVKSEPILSSVRGVLKQVDCDVTTAKLTVASGSGMVRLLIANPDAIVIRNQPGRSVNLTCGPQTKVTNVAVEYLDKVDGKGGTIGEVRTVEFLN